MLGDGCVNYPPLMRLLTEQAYHGWLVVETEQDPAVAHPLTYARLGDNNLNRLARDAGERCLVLVAGHAFISTPTARFDDIGERMSPFERIKPGRFMLRRRKRSRFWR